MVGNKVKFAYIATGGSLPASYPDLDTIYFLEESKEIRVGSRPIANIDDSAINMSQLAEVLEAYTIKSVEIIGSGDNVSNISLNSTTGKLSVTKSNLPVLSKGAATTPSSQTLSPGGIFEVVTDTSVSGHTITDGKTRFTLPIQVNDLSVTSNNGKLIFTLLYSNGTSGTPVEFSGLGSAAFENASQFATAAQGVKADNAMPASNGTATGAKITLKNDPSTNMEAATKQYVDNAVQTSAHAPSTYTRVTITAAGWSAYDAIYRYTNILPATNYHFYDIHLASDSANNIGTMCANARIKAKVENSSIVLYCYGAVPTQSFDIEIITSEIDSNHVSLSYDIGDDYLVYPSIVDALTTRISELESQTSSMIYASQNIILAAGAWTSSGDSTYPYKASITMTGVTSSYFSMVQFKDSDASIYEFDSSVVSGTNTVTIQCKNVPSVAITIPSIICYKCTII